MPDYTFHLILGWGEDGESILLNSSHSWLCFEIVKVGEVRLPTQPSEVVPESVDTCTVSTSYRFCFYCQKVSEADGHAITCVLEAECSVLLASLVKIPGFCVRIIVPDFRFSHFEGLLWDLPENHTVCSHSREILEARVELVPDQGGVQDLVCLIYIWNLYFSHYFVREIG